MLRLKITLWLPLVVSFLWPTVSTERVLRECPNNHFVEQAFQKLPPGIGEHRFNQKVDHFNLRNPRTFQQRYFSNRLYYNGNGRVFLKVGGQAVTDLREVFDALDTNWLSNAAHFEAFCFMLEHRYYGESNVTTAAYNYRDTSTLNLRWLTTSQALADIETFIGTVKRRFRNPKWILFGCSYGASLAAWFRLQYPHLALGAVASSPTLEAKLNFYEHLEVANKVLNAYSAMCVATIAAASEEIEWRIRTKYRVTELKQTFKLCSQCQFESEMDTGTVFQQLYTVISELVKDSGINVGKHKNVLTVEQFCDEVMYSSDKALASYAKATTNLLQELEIPCLICSYQEMVKVIKEMCI